MMVRDESGAVALPKKSAEADKSDAAPVDDAGKGVTCESTDARGASNTPRPSSFNTCIDYLKMRFDWMYMKGNEQFRDLFRILLIDEDKYIVKPGSNGYEVMMVFDEGLVLQIGGETTKNALGNNTTLLEMQGKACRLFEERICNTFPFEAEDDLQLTAVRNGWLKLLEKLADMGGHCTRIDLPTDDLTGIVPFDELREKIAERQFTSNMRAFTLDDQLPKSADTARVRQSKNAGYTATLGTRDTVQLCIYNKLAERLRHGGTLNVSFWIRYEVRYYHANADRAFDGLLNAYEEGTESEFIVGCLSSCISFKEKRETTGHNMSRVPTWAKWDNFISSVKAQKMSKRTRPEPTVKSNAQWAMKEASKILAILTAVNREKFEEMYHYLVQGGADKLEPEDLIRVNNYLDAKEKPKFKDLAEMYAYVMATPGVSTLMGPDLFDLFYGDGARLGSARYLTLPGNPSIDISQDDPGDIDGKK